MKIKKFQAAIVQMKSSINKQDNLIESIICKKKYNH